MSTVSPRICVILNIKRILWTFYLVFWRLFTTNADSSFNLMRIFSLFLFSVKLQQREVSATRSGNLVQELYIENAKLTKALQQTEANEKRAEKANRQLTEQKKALQRVISKLCGANAIAWRFNCPLAILSWAYWGVNAYCWLIWPPFIEPLVLLSSKLIWSLEVPFMVFHNMHSLCGRRVWRNNFVQPIDFFSASLKVNATAFWNRYHNSHDMEHWHCTHQQGFEPNDYKQYIRLFL